MNLSVFFTGSVPKLETIAAELRRRGLPLEIEDTAIDLASHTGFLPMKRNDSVTGVEIYCGSSSEAREELGPDRIDAKFDCELLFRWGSDMNECACACALAAIFADLTGGIIYDDSCDAISSSDKMIDEAKSALAYVKKPKRKLNLE